MFHFLDMPFEDTNTVNLKKKYPLKCVCIYRKNNTNDEFLSHFFYKSLNLCSTDQLKVEVIRNCDMPFFAEN